jgi:hypothetical protein
MGTGSAAAFRTSSKQMEAKMTSVQARPAQSRRASETASPSPAGDPSTLEITTQWPKFDVALVSVEGHVDAAASADLLYYALSKALLCRLLILNLERVQSLSRSGYDMLRTLESRCAIADVELTVLHGVYADASAADLRQPPGRQPA